VHDANGSKAGTAGSGLQAKPGGSYFGEFRDDMKDLPPLPTPGIYPNRVCVCGGLGKGVSCLHASARPFAQECLCVKSYNYATPIAIAAHKQLLKCGNDIDNRNNHCSYRTSRIPIQARLPVISLTRSISSDHVITQPCNKVLNLQ
jgi:hypothetical protein